LTLAFPQVLTSRNILGRELTGVMLYIPKAKQFVNWKKKLRNFFWISATDENLKKRLHACPGNTKHKVGTGGGKLYWKIGSSKI
jgi:hypothetical protein